jgi:hypothetical protein
MQIPHLESIRLALAPGFETELFEAALKNLDDVGNRLQFNNFAYALRETFQHVLNRLAPDDCVVRCQWYVVVPDVPKGISRRQRARYAVQGGLSDGFVSDTLKLGAKSIQDQLVKTIGELNKFTHISPESFDVPAAEVNRLRDSALAAFSDLLATVSDCRQRILGRLAEEIDEAAIEQVLQDPLVGIDALASHFSVQNVSIGSVKIVSVDHERIHIEAHGMVDCILQFGSNSDLRNGDGAEIPQSFKFRSELFCPVDDPDELIVEDDSVGIDTTEWERARYGADEYDDR